MQTSAIVGTTWHKTMVIKINPLSTKSMSKRDFCMPQCTVPRNRNTSEKLSMKLNSPASVLSMLPP